MYKIPYIVTIVLVLLAGISAILVQTWTGFVYFAMSFAMLLGLFWGGWLIYKYFTDFKLELEESFKFYKAETINKKQISSEYFNENEAAFKKDFQKKMTKYKILHWLKILLCFSISAAFIAAMIIY